MLIEIDGVMNVIESQDGWYKLNYRKNNIYYNKLNNYSGIGLNTVFKETLGNNGNNGLKMPDSTLLFCP